MLDSQRKEQIKSLLGGRVREMEGEKRCRLEEKIPLALVPCNLFTASLQQETGPGEGRVVCTQERAAAICSVSCSCGVGTSHPFPLPLLHGDPPGPACSALALGP